MEREHTYTAEGTASTTRLSGEQLNQLSQPFDPQETFSLTLEVDATDALEKPKSHPVAVVAGVTDRESHVWHQNRPDDPSALMNTGTALRTRYFEHYGRGVQETAGEGCAYTISSPIPPVH